MPAPAPAPAPASASSGALGQGFGEQGQIVISNEGFFGFDKVNHGGYDVVLKPAVDYFIVPSISAGSWPPTSSRQGRRPRRTTSGVGLRGGFNFNVTENLGVWGKLGVLYQRDSARARPRSRRPGPRAFVPVMYHIVPHLFVGLAPYYNLKFAGDGNHSYGFSWLIGGWF